MAIDTKIYKRRSLEDLTLKDNFLFTAVMSNPDNCKDLLQIILNIEIDRVDVDYEKSIISHPEYRSIRMDVYVKDEKNTRYNIEMQVASEKLEKRTRYYHSQMDLDILSTSVPYEELPDTYVIFICDFDPFGENKYCYSVKKTFQESPELIFQDGSYTIFLSTMGTNREDISDELYEFLEFLRLDKDSMMKLTENAYLHRLQNSITEIKRNRIWGDRFMRLEEIIEREKREARRIGREEGSLYTMKRMVLQLAENKKCDASFLENVENCDNLEELNRIFTQLLDAN